MKTNLPEKISSIEEAKAFLLELCKNGESFHPEDNANDLTGNLFTKEEGDKLNSLMNDIYSLEGNESSQSMIFDPCEFILDWEANNGGFGSDQKK